MIEQSRECEDETERSSETVREQSREGEGESERAEAGERRERTALVRLTD